MELSRIRNFCIIAHIDHGKSTLADRFLEITGTVEKRKMREQLLDQMDIERERGITIKLQPVRMEYQGFQLNLIDTPGHVDFSYEVSRSLAACEGAVLVVDASQGIEAQTLANLYLALEQKLTIIPVINKIDLPNAKPQSVARELQKLIGIDAGEIFFCSAKTGQGVPELLSEVIRRVPAPHGDTSANLRALIFDSKYDAYKGVEAYVRIIDGMVRGRDQVKFIATDDTAELIEVGVFRPQAEKTGQLQAGEVGYLSTGLKDLGKVRVGDTVGAVTAKTEALQGYREPKPVVYASIFPVDGDEYELLRDALGKLKLNDSSLHYEPESSTALGFGFRVGLLGLLHLEIVQERLSREYDLEIIVTSPSVSYQVKFKNESAARNIYTPAEFPTSDKIEQINEPWANIEIITPTPYLGDLIRIICERRGVHQNTEYLAESRALIRGSMPLGNLIIGFYDALKSVSQGYASLNYDLGDYRPADLVRLDIMINKERVEAFTTIIHRSQIRSRGLSLVNKLKEVLPRQNFTVPIQAALGGEIVARADIRAYRKDVTGYLYGGDVTRKKKLLEKQKRGKKKMKTMGRMDIPQKAFLDILKLD